jgi:predicted patatin/cPLA2 family phospholipase
MVEPLQPPVNLANPAHPVIEEIRRRRAGGEPLPGVKLALVVEGGGMRGVISGGALVALEKLGLCGVFDEVYGESAGAINACYFLAGQAEFGSRIYADYLSTLRFVNPLRLGTILDIGYAIYDVVGGSMRLDCDAVLRSPSRMFVALTEVERGVSRLVDVKSEGIPLLKLLEGTGAITPLYNKPVEIQGAHYVDGGITNPIPVKSAIQQGCTHILVLLTRPLGFVMRPYNTFERALLWPFFRKWPLAFARTFYEVRYPNYNDARAVALGSKILRDGVQIAAVLPAEHSRTITRTTTSRQRLAEALAESVEQTLALFR